MQTNVTTPTMPIGMSRSVIGSVSALPALRARDAAIAPERPRATGFTNLSKVQTADTPIAPAPMKRTLWLQEFCARAAALLVGSRTSLEYCGTPQPQPIH